MSDTCAPFRGKIPALHEATEAVGESGEPKVTVKKAEEGNGKLEEREISIFQLEMSPHGKAMQATRQGSSRKFFHASHKLSYDAPGFILRTQMSQDGSSNVAIGDESGAVVAATHTMVSIWMQTIQTIGLKE
ncbi:hypothetical protein Pmar_PMAR027688 [Perkinsus marinus ATCC 50983]|uniref:Uncharacterized protein n=1 Tax=Perkinsus marinus (strain ATCC 50983 / TXsc) TaxID=423536 RepID=C5KSJ9_PERM5|nr:hypothetical protein Pmar_PMAR027688 [Perkinsus marinus ATCC 50983]EER12548.1 hypothetical protein Pmar_PMAR027688 [Perkinsus marinus ATCC 50983]|eukprot:XP_002780753.1 hypothetical protein Pmar_PMAR027688 [Perkinsus marinus ATCC 50983]